MRAANENRRPPLTTLDTRFTRMVRSSNCSSLLFTAISELQSLGPGGVGQRRHPPVIGESAAVEDHGGDSGVLGAGGHEGAHRLGRVDIAALGLPQGGLD